MAGNAANRIEATVLGAGPAALAVAGELALLGVRTTLCAPSPEAPWLASYGTFEELLPSPYRQAVAYRFESPKWVTRQGVSSTLEAPYVRLDTSRLQGLLLDRARGAGVKFVARSIEGSPNEALPGQLVVDARGRSFEHENGSRYQSAYGMWVRLSRDDWLLDGQMTFMDLRPATLGSPPAEPPSFLYATREGAYHFVQETVLVADEPCAFSELEKRLWQRLAWARLSVTQVAREEKCCIPMGGTPTPGRANTVALGARAGLTQPASGYQLARCLELAPSVAAAIAEGGSPEACAERARAVVWSLERRATFALFNYGAGVLAKFGQKELTAFLEVFLGMPETQLVQFIDGRLGLGGVIQMMSRTFSKVDRDLKWRLVGAS